MNANALQGHLLRECSRADMDSTMFFGSLYINWGLIIMEHCASLIAVSVEAKGHDPFNLFFRLYGNVASDQKEKEQYSVNYSGNCPLCNEFRPCLGSPNCTKNGNKGLYF